MKRTRRNHGATFLTRIKDARLEFTGFLKDHDIQISMEGKGSWRDNVFVERLWKSIKYEEVYLYAYESVSTAQHDT